jgi:phosphohistidine phosphatase
MKTLLLLRHAKSSWKYPDLADHDRPLNKRGKQTAPRVGQLLKDENLLPDLILSSTAARAQTTARKVTKASGYAGEIRVTRDLYEAGPEAYLTALRAVADEHNRVLVVGHNPGLEELLEQLTDETEALPTAALALIELPINRWAELSEATEGKLVRVWRPKELAA